MGMIHSDPPCTCWRNNQGRGQITCNTPLTCEYLAARVIEPADDDEDEPCDSESGEGAGVLLWPLAVLAVVSAAVAVMVFA